MTGIAISICRCAASASDSGRTESLSGSEQEEAQQQDQQHDQQEEAQRPDEEEEVEEEEEEEEPIITHERSGRKERAQVRA